MWCETTAITEFDLVHLGDGCAVNRHAVLETHLFHDRLMRIAPARMDAGSTLGPSSALLPDTRLGAGACVGGRSVVMRGEELPAGTRWQGAPVASAPASPRTADDARVAAHGGRGRPGAGGDAIPLGGARDVSERAAAAMAGGPSITELEHAGAPLVLQELEVPAAAGEQAPRVLLVDASGAARAGARPAAVQEHALRAWVRRFSAEAGATHSSRSYRLPLALLAWHGAPVGVDIERVERCERGLRGGDPDAARAHARGRRRSQPTLQLAVVEQGGALEGARGPARVRPAPTRGTGELAGGPLGPLARRGARGRRAARGVGLLARLLTPAWSRARLRSASGCR